MVLVIEVIRVQRDIVRRELSDNTPVVGIAACRPLFRVVDLRLAGAMVGKVWERNALNGRCLAELYTQKPRGRPYVRLTLAGLSTCKS